MAVTDQEPRYTFGIQQDYDEVHNPPPRPPFNDKFHEVNIPERTKIVGRTIWDLFRKKYKRPTPWEVTDAGIYVYTPYLEPTDVEQLEGAPETPAISQRRIMSNGLEKESVPDGLYVLMHDFSNIEWHLDDYTGRSLELFRANRGMTRSFLQWSPEEDSHGAALERSSIVMGRGTADSMHDQFVANLSKTWELPFPTDRQIVIYSALQERRTNGYYLQMRDIAKAEGAHNLADVFALIARDEAFHSAAYIDYAAEYAKLDPVGTALDAAHVAAHFRMPAQNISLDNPIDSVKALRNYDQMVSRADEAMKFIFPVLQKWDFVSDEQAIAAVGAYAGEKNLARKKFLVNWDGGGKQLLDRRGRVLASTVKDGESPAN